MRDRVKALREELGLNKSAFAQKIGVSRGFITLFENGDRELSGRTIKDICRTFNVNETWLISGEGDMFADESREERIARLMATIINEHKDDELLIEFIEDLCKLDKAQMIALKNLLDAMLHK